MQDVLLLELQGGSIDTAVRAWWESRLFDDREACHSGVAQFLFKSLAMQGVSRLSDVLRPSETMCFARRK